MKIFGLLFLALGLAAGLGVYLHEMCHPPERENGEPDYRSRGDE